jgi:hypothetical protein
MLKETCSCGKQFDCPEDERDLRTFIANGYFELFFAGVDIGVDRAFCYEKCHDCSRRASLEKLMKFIKINQQGGVEVKWKEYINSLNTNLRYVNSTLSKLGVLSGYGEGNWIIMSQTRGCLNPLFGGKSVNLYFTSPDDAVSYADFMNSSRGCYVMRIGDVIQI